MKRGMVLLLMCSFILYACGKTTVLLDESKMQNDLSEEKTSVVESTEYKEISNDKKVDVILTMVKTDDVENIDDYVSNLQKQNPNSVYSIYDNEHYAETIMETERKAVLESMKNKNYVDDMFMDMFTDEQYNGCFISMDYNNDYSKFTFFVDKEAFNNSGIASSLAPLYICSILSDTFQGYGLVNPSDRKLTVEYIDNETKEEIYSTDDEK